MVKVNLPSEILSQKDVKLIIESINSSKELQKQWFNERKLGYDNGKYLDRWNYIFDNIEKSFTDNPYLTYAVSRGPLWKFIVLYNTTTKILYLILRESTFKQIKNKKDNPYHYVRILNSKNYHLQREVKEQLNLFTGFESISDEYIDQDLDRMISDIKNEVKGCVNILFKENSEGVYKLTGNFANYDLDILKTYDLSSYITADIDNIVDTKTDSTTSQPVIPLGIRENKIKSNKYKILKDKNKKGVDTETQ